MKKFLVLAASALVFGGVLASATPALALPPVAPVVTLVTPSVVENAAKVTLTSDQLNVPAGFCVVANLAWGIVETYNPTDVLPNYDADAGTFTPINSNLTSAPVTYSVDVYSVAVNCTSPRALVSSTAWTVNPRLAVATPADFTVGVPASQTVASTLHDATGGPVVDLSAGAHWAVVPGALCQNAFAPGGIVAPTYVALPAGFSIDPTVSGAGIVPPLTFAGTATADEIGSYLLCLNLVGVADPTTPDYAQTTLTIVPAPVIVPALANTGFDPSSLVAGGAGVLALGVLLVAPLRRRKATV